MFVRWARLTVLAVAARAATPPPPAPRNGTGAVDIQLFGDTLEALRVMQNVYFQSWIGTWPTAIDWTAAVMGTQVAGALDSLSDGFETLRANKYYEFSTSENLISLYFTQLVSFYFGQDALSLRNQAYDDMLWVVLGWLDAIKFAKSHSKAHYEASAPQRAVQGWHGTAWFPAFAHRARIFWHLASAGWDTQLCGGGMNWNPRLMPYKNAITNELWISASTAMYLHFPGDDNSSPFKTGDGETELATAGSWPRHDSKYKDSAIVAHKWLAASNMTNNHGLYVDGFHISGYKPGVNNTGKKCDERDEMVYTYNQGTILTGLRELYTITGKSEYLEEGHQLIRAVIKATGWDITKNSPVQDLKALQGHGVPAWYGLGRAGILEEACDILATCSQDAQTFKGIWMHHFTTFCKPLDEPFDGENMNPYIHLRNANSHIESCKGYKSWLQHNADAARNTRDGEGRYGMWWTVGLMKEHHVHDLYIVPEDVSMLAGATDYRNDGVPNNSIWMMAPPHSDGRQRPMQKRDVVKLSDANDRGRGRTVETQSGGLALLRALWEISRLP
jgi:hypothetical protein